MDVTQFLGIIVDGFVWIWTSRTAALPIISWSLPEMVILARWDSSWRAVWTPILRMEMDILPCMVWLNFSRSRHAAASYGYLEILQLLVSHGGSRRWLDKVNCRCDVEGCWWWYSSSCTSLELPKSTGKQWLVWFVGVWRSFLRRLPHLARSQVWRW